MSSFSLKDKVPPHNLEAEQATLGALLLDWEAVGTVIRYLRPDRFYSLQNQKVFTAILSLFNKGQRGDILTIIEELRATGDLDSSGGASYITSLTDTVPTSANVEYYAKIVLDQAVRRDLLKLSANMVMQSHDETIKQQSCFRRSTKRNIQFNRFQFISNYKNYARTY